MRSYAHWTPRYLLARSREFFDQKLRPDDPWLTREAIGLLERLLRPMDTALEFGSGRSTIWFASRVGRLTSVEDNQSWHRVVSEKLAMKRVSNVNFLYHPQDVQTGAEAGSASYVRVVSEFADESLDFVLVDGIYRNHCALGAVPKVRPGGLIVIDNVNWFLPSTSRSPRARTLAQGPADEVWAQFADATNGWRRIWTTSGVTDTLLLFKP